MTTVDTSPIPAHGAAHSDWLTALSLGMLAYICSDLAHEVFGHGAGLFLAGGRSGVLTTTRLIYTTQLPDPAWRFFDIGGPAGNLVWAGICILLLRLLRGSAPHLKLYLWTSMCISLFWEAGYLILSGVKGRGDWMALVDGLPAEWLGRTLLVIAGYLLFRGSVYIAKILLRSIAPAGSALTLLTVLATGGTLIAIAGAFLDPRGRMEMLNSGALSMVTAWVGLIQIGRRTANSEPGTTFLSRSYAVIVLATVAAVTYVAVLGPGIPVSLGRR